jgi:hypothetical protein
MTATSILATLESKPLFQFTQDEMSEARELALRILRADYYQDVRNVAQDARDAIDSGEIASYDQLQEYVDQSVDGSGRVIYTAQAQECILLSDHADAYFDECGDGDGLISEGSINWSQLAFSAFRHDVHSQLAIDSDYFDDSEDDDCDDVEPESDSDQIEEGDITTEDGVRFYQNGKLWLECKPDEIDDSCAMVKAKMECENFFPNVWMISDHGNAIPFDLDD